MAASLRGQSRNDKAATPSERLVLDEGHDVALAVLEPRGLHAVADGDVALHGEAADLVGLVVLEHDAARAQLLDFLLHVVDLPEGLARLRGAGAVARVVEERGGVVAELVGDAAFDLLALEAHLVLVEAAGARDVTGWNIGIERMGLEHGGSPCGRSGRTE